MRNLVVFGALLMATVAGCSCPPDCGCIDHEDVLNFYETNVEVIQARVSKAFDNAEKKVLEQSVVVPTPKGPHEDPDKCVCGGSGKIKHGDGHTTPCPFHSGEFNLKVDGNVLYKRSK